MTCNSCNNCNGCNGCNGDGGFFGLFGNNCSQCLTASQLYYARQYGLIENCNNGCGCSWPSLTTLADNSSSNCCVYSNGNTSSFTSNSNCNCNCNCGNF